MRLVVTESYEAMSRAAAAIIAETLAAKPDAALVLPSGETPLRLYRELAGMKASGATTFEQVRIFQLDEYQGLAPEDPRSLFAWLGREVLVPLGIAPEQVVKLPGDAPDPTAACRAYDEALAAVGGYDLAVLGLGPNGHLGYNDPPAPADAPSRVVELSESSIAIAARSFGGREQVPPQALTAGMAQLLAARSIVLLVAGAHKREILRQALRGPVTPDVPASFLQHAPQAVVIADRAAWPEE